MPYPATQRELTIHLNNSNWYLRPIEDPKILGPVDYGWQRYNLYPDSFTFGEGLLAGSSIPGSRRLVFSAWSPQWEGFYISSIGGAAYTFHNLGVPYVALRGRAPQPSARPIGAGQPRGAVDRLRQPAWRAVDRFLRPAAGAL
jgi:glyceraldehyde-3-phosphate dehydrogenase (ferredoxin)